MYHATLGRWIQRDPAGYVDGMGLYHYGAAAPTANVDPLGLEAAMTDPVRDKYEAGVKSRETWKLPRDFDLVIVTGGYSNPKEQAAWVSTWTAYAKAAGTRVVFVIPPDPQKVKDAMVARYKEVAGKEADQRERKIEVKLKILYVGHGGEEFRKGLGVPEPPRGQPGDIWFGSSNKAVEETKRKISASPIAEMRNRISEVVFTNCAVASTGPGRRLLHLIAEDLHIGSIKAGTRDLTTNVYVSPVYGGDVYVTPSTPPEGERRHYGYYVYDTETGRTLLEKGKNGAGTY
jgi:hypothetical protein